VAGTSWHCLTDQNVPCCAQSASGLSRLGPFHRAILHSCHSRCILGQLERCRDVRQSTFFVQASDCPQFGEHFAYCLSSLHLPEQLGMLLVAFIQVAGNQLLLVLFAKFSIFDFLLLCFDQLLAFLFVCCFTVLQSQRQLIIYAAGLVAGVLGSLWSCRRSVGVV